MTTGVRLGAYGLVLAAALAVGAALGAVAGPIDVGGDDHSDEPAHVTVPVDEAKQSDDGSATSTTRHEGDHGGFGP